MSYLNKLSLDSIPECLKLNEVETVLIARNILFLKLFRLPKSLWSAVKDKVINVPITSDDILNSLEEIKSFPRPLADSGLIPVEFKRKKEYKSKIFHRFVNVEKLIAALKTLKELGHTGYQDIKINENYHVEYETQEDDGDGDEKLR